MLIAGRSCAHPSSSNHYCSGGANSGTNCKSPKLVANTICVFYDMMALDCFT